MQSLNTKHKKTDNGVEIHVKGTVQGVGFRPFIYNLASGLLIDGTVSNSSDGVHIKAFASKPKLDLFLSAIEDSCPPLARINSVTVRSFFEDQTPDSFVIIQSTKGETTNTTIPADNNLCKDCLQEFLDPQDRRYHYPFINCTNCGPRFSIIETIPYDRPLTSMKVFEMCDSCSKEYQDPSNRRFHAQPNACPDCGPYLFFTNKYGNTIPISSPIAETVRVINCDLVIGIRGLGGFHLCVSAFSEKGVDLLRARKKRPNKPLAIMVKNLDVAKKIAVINEYEENLLTSSDRPIVVLEKSSNSQLATNLAPGINEIGILLPYTPLHHLLFEQPNCPEALVMTSGNISGEPICISNEDAAAKLSTIVDYFLFHNREIVTRVDDSVVKRVANQNIVLRRARGMAPLPINTSQKLPSVIGCGAGLKSTISLTQDNNVILSQHIGDLDNEKTFDFYRETQSHFSKLFQHIPAAVACDFHPDYLSSNYAKSCDLPLYPVQHHHAHAVAVMAEHTIDQPVLAIILDGTGLGSDGTIWGGEILRAELTDFTRLGHLANLHLPGGDKGAKEPWRMGLSAIFNSSLSDAIDFEKLPPSLQALDEQIVQTVASMLSSGFNVPFTSSCGRLFDAVSSLLGICQNNSYEGQAAMELESVAQKAMKYSWCKTLDNFSKDLWYTTLIQRTNHGMWTIDTPALLSKILQELSKGVAVQDIALRFHANLILSLSALVDKLSKELGITQVVLSGGCMQNSLLLEGFFHVLCKNDLHVFTGNNVPINDGAISLGQAIIGGLRHVSGNTYESN